MPLDDQISLDSLLDDAFAPARLRTAGISAARVRARVAWERDLPVSRGWRALSMLGRLGETSLAVGMTAILFAGSLGSLGGPTESAQPERGSEFVVRISAPLDESRFLRLLRLDRTAPVFDDLDPAMALTLPVDDDPLVAQRERQGPLR